MAFNRFSRFSTADEYEQQTYTHAPKPQNIGSNRFHLILSIGDAAE